MLHLENLENLIINKHTQNNSDKLIFLGGYIGASPIQNLINKLPKDNSIKCDLIYGCYKKANVNEVFHNTYKKITQHSPINIYYKRIYNHSKIYMWYKNNKPIDCLLGSANFSTSGLCHDNSETLIDVREQDFESINKLLVNARLDSIISTSKIYIDKYKGKQKDTKTKRLTSNLDTVLSKSPPRANIYLGEKPGYTHDKSGLNWGFGKGHIAKDAAYIPIRKQLIDELPELFPYNGISPNVGSGQGIRNKQAADAIFDDGTTMQLSFEGIAKPHFFKNLTSYPKNNILGKYIRKRLGLDIYEKVTYDILKRYGRTNITITKIDEGNYFLDFSVNSYVK